MQGIGISVSLITNRLCFCFRQNYVTFRVRIYPIQTATARQSIPEESVEWE